MYTCMYINIYIHKISYRRSCEGRSPFIPFYILSLRPFMHPTILQILLPRAKIYTTVINRKKNIYLNIHLFVDFYFYMGLFIYYLCIHLASYLFIKIKRALPLIIDEYDKANCFT